MTCIDLEIDAVASQLLRLFPVKATETSFLLDLQIMKFSWRSMPPEPPV